MAWISPEQVVIQKREKELKREKKKETERRGVGWGERDPKTEAAL